MGKGRKTVSPYSIRLAASWTHLAGWRAQSGTDLRDSKLESLLCPCCGRERERASETTRRSVRIEFQGLSREVQAELRPRRESIKNPRTRESLGLERNFHRGTRAHRVTQHSFKGSPVFRPLNAGAESRPASGLLACKASHGGVALGTCQC